MYVCVVATYIFSYKHGQCMCIGCHCDIVHTYPQFVVMPHNTTGLLLWCMAQHPARVLHYRTASVVYGTTPLHVCCSTGLLLWCMAQHPCTCAALPSRAMHPAVCTLTTAGPTQNLPQHTVPFTNTHIGLNMYTYIYTLYIYSTKKLTHAYLPCLSVPYRTHARNVVSHPQLQ